MYNHTEIRIRKCLTPNSSPNNFYEKSKKMLIHKIYQIVQTYSNIPPVKMQNSIVPFYVRLVNKIVRITFNAGCALNRNNSYSVFMEKLFQIML